MLNTKLFAWFRKSYLKALRKRVDPKPDARDFLCHIRTWHSVFMCWKDVAEVQSNLDSECITPYVRLEKTYNCRVNWFMNNQDRIKFIDECLAKLK